MAQNLAQQAATRWRPESEAELVEMVRGARSERRAFEVVGHGTKRGLGRLIDSDVLLDLSALSGIVAYEPDELVLTARAATPLAEIAAAIAPNRHRIGFDPADWSGLYANVLDAGTIGGILSADACGPARVRYGACRDHLLGFRAVNGFGQIYKAGGRVVKNVTGFDLPKLLCGAMGTLGIFTDVTLRLVPCPAAAITLMVRNADATIGFELLRAIWSSPLEATGLAFLPQSAIPAFPELGEVGNGAVLVRLEGAPDVLEDKVRAAYALLRPHEVLGCTQGQEIFQRIGWGAAFANRSLRLWRVFVPPANAAKCAEASASKFWLADWAGGVIWQEGAEPGEIHALAARFGGHAVLMRADAPARRAADMVSPEPPARRALTERVKAAFDPLALFNPGRMYDGI